ncbi:type IV secretion system DNA-binding domain-containing protein [Porphyrobacter sp. CACIAM 03H1]|uniref:type IV secretion system DNA-binding domain-containing protein n=1 Tax=Porphyrobacter sp. CACIAM 03H1 TaxID=2003315 RepID=UPI000B5A2A38|nr:type IV secretion system DNA-binding domain-containing protein [Porphyrobacter sp. CACIAM 03H1]ASJ92001.1 conjugal transfer protein TraD [Porphyrobacter sp. CACIAM 03H1]
MKRNLDNFTRGSQLLGHFGFMFAAGLKGPLIIAAVVISWTSWWTLSSALTDYELYLIWMRVYAAAYGFMEFSPDKLVTVKTSFGGTMQLPIGMLGSFPPVVRAWDHMTDLVASAAWRSAVFLIPAFALFYGFAARFGSKAKDRKFVRGAQLVDLRELVRRLRRHNREKRNLERTAAIGWKWWLCLPWELAKAFPYRPAHIADVVYPWRLEPSHTMLIGTTGTGKTVAISAMIEEARAKGQNCVVFDLTGAFIEQFYDAKRDVILNPLDARCPQWSLFDECRTEADFWTAADALVPHDGGGDAQFWVLGARALFVKFCVELVAQGRGSNAALAQELMAADLSDVHEQVKNTMAGPITAPEAARMAESVRAVFNVNAKALELLPTEGPRFSVREWIEQSAEKPAGRGSILFVSSRYVDMSVTSQLLTLWLDTAMNTLMTSARTNEVTCWFFIDELGALHRLPALEKGLQTARNFGGAIVLGLHAYAKLKEVYGENMAPTLASLARTKLILSVADKETATWCSDFIGHEEVIDTDVGYSYGVNNARDAVSLTRRTTIRPLRMPEELMNMKSLEGYLKFPEGFPAAPVRLRPMNRPKVADAFIVRGPNRPLPPAQLDAPMPPRPKPGGLPGEVAAAHSSSGDDGGGKSTLRFDSAPKQGELAFDKATGEAAQPDRAVASEAARQMGTDAAGKLPAGSASPTDLESAKGDQATLGKGRHGHPADPSGGLDNPHGNDRPTLKPGPKSGAKSNDRAIRQNPSPGRQKAKDGAERSANPPAKSGGAKVTDPPSRKGGAPASPPRSSDARKLLNEDGIPERSEPPKDTRDLGDLEI